jgi:nonsense-mediated mRNA decay protein 3
MIPNLNKQIRLVDAGLVWTEPHCKRIKIKVTVQKAVDEANGQIMQQSTIVEYVVRTKQCVKCMASFTNAGWNSCVQLRQRVDHKRTLFFLEQMVITQNAHQYATDVVLSPDGLDFYFADRKRAIAFTQFISSVIPTREKFSNMLIGTNISDGTENRKYTLFMEIAPVCKDDLLLLHPKLAASLGNISPVVLVRKVRSSFLLIDPLSLDTAELTGDKYWKCHTSKNPNGEATLLLSSKLLTPFVVLDIETSDEDYRRRGGRDEGGEEGKRHQEQVW